MGVCYLVGYVIGSRTNGRGVPAKTHWYFVSFVSLITHVVTTRTAMHRHHCLLATALTMRRGLWDRSG